MANITVRRTPWRSHLTPFFSRQRDLPGTNVRRMFDTMFGEPMGTELLGYFPVVDIVEVDGKFKCVAELPGIKPEDVQVSFEDGVLTIKGEKTDEREENEGSRYHVFERSYGTFERSFTFPTEIDPDNIKADFSNGVLTVIVPKSTTGHGAARQIPINSSSTGSQSGSSGSESRSSRGSQRTSGSPRADSPPPNRDTE